MQMRRLGKSDIHVSEIGFGTMSLSENIEEARLVLEAGIEKGMNYVDTADLYQFGKNEEVVGEIIKGRREQLVLASKGGNHWQEGRMDWFWDPSKAYIKEACKNSLRRLGTDYLDVYQLHGGTIDDPIDETIEAFQELKQEGLIRAFGISSIRPNVIKEYADSGMTSVCNTICWTEDLKNRCIFSIKMTSVSSEVRSQKACQKSRERRLKKVSIIRKVKCSLRRMRCRQDTWVHPLQLAIRYVLHHPAVSTVTAGASSVEQVLENVGAMDLPSLTDEEYEKLQRSSQAIVYEQHR
ncbi:LOW QUALITY PROTEIN: predicted oxidoreductase [Geomicrobium sp. JCM 19037]|nr:LOW QUALITY PROTEIN: predicted oxidoreductase [Geomicrobium sp. JCM 19037]